MNSKCFARTLSAFAATICSYLVFSQELNYSLSTQNAILAEPVYLEVTLNAPVPPGETWVTCEGFLQVSVDGPSGHCKKTFDVQATLAQPYSPWERATVRLDSAHSRWVKRMIINEEYIMGAPGTYKIQIKWKTPPLDALGLARARHVLDKESPGMRQIFLETFGAEKEAKLELLCPKGLDAQAFEVFAGASCPKALYSCVSLIRYTPEKMVKLLKSYPTSTYAAYLVFDKSGCQGLTQSDPDKVLKAFETDMYTVREIWVPWEKGLGDPDKYGQVPLTGEAAFKWREKWFGIVLKNHPDIWFADQLKLNLAVDQLALKNYPAAEADLKALADAPKSPVAGKARQYLDLMRQKGWTAGPETGKAKGARQGGAGSGGAS